MPCFSARITGIRANRVWFYRRPGNINKVQVVGGDGPLTFSWLRTDSIGYSFPSSFGTGRSELIYIYNFL
jgi:hypothetical protein